ncbi:WAT1-related protein At3g28050-like isoform X4 [Silene latifolia]|uniref:WAT1-related protein At3g28050-like isoform X4 n=1 Tax=Silene latifolia TaxID=37657 RepID=UPI003D784DAB
MWEVKMVGVIVLMVTIEVMEITGNTIGKVAMAKGLSSYIFTTYTHGIAFFFLIPAAFFFHRKIPVPPIGFSMIFRMFLLGCGCAGYSVLTYLGIHYSSPTLASAMNNLSPALTFLMGILFSYFVVPQTWIVRDFRSEVLITLISFFFEILVAGLVAFVAEEDKSVWTPSIEIMWIALLFGALQVGVSNTVHTWACGKKGPLFVAMFKPLQMVIAVIMGVSFLSDVLHLGSVIGGTIIGVGFYTVMKGKAEEEIKKEGDESAVLYSSEEDNCPHQVPLLQNQNIDV